MKNEKKTTAKKPVMSAREKLDKIVHEAITKYPELLKEVQLEFASTNVKDYINDLEKLAGKEKVDELTVKHFSK